LGSGRVVGFGEALIRLTTPDRTRLEQAPHIIPTIGGTELNTLIAAAWFGHATTFVTRLPDNPLGARIAAHARAYGVEVAAEWDPGARAGLYFVEPGAPPRPTEVLYDRAASAATRLAPGQIAWDTVLAGAGLLHSTGITCALGAGPRDTVAEAFTAAVRLGVRTSLDLNYRSRLWSPEEAAEAFRRIVPLADVVFASAHDLALVLGHPGAALDLARELRTGPYAGARPPTIVLRDSARPEPGRVRVTVTIVGDGAADGETTGDPADAEVVDSFGAGDVAAGAYLAAALSGADPRTAAGLAARACAHMHTIVGDAWIARPGELDPGYGDGRSVLR
jgi:2-dehydro-3-deoxygluconokinase